MGALVFPSFVSSVFAGGRRRLCEEKTSLPGTSVLARHCRSVNHTLGQTDKDTTVGHNQAVHLYNTVIANRVCHQKQKVFSQFCVLKCKI